MLVDFGAETTTVSIYKDGVLQYLATVPLGSEAITCDLASVLSVTDEQARDIKERMADVTAENQENARINIINETVRGRAMQIIANILKQIEFAGFENKDLAGGIVVTGGGSLLRHFVQCLEKYARMPVRPAEVSGVQASDNTLVSSAYFPLMASIAEAARCARLLDPLECLQEPVVTSTTDTDVNTGFAVEGNGRGFNNGGRGVEAPAGHNHVDDDIEDDPESTGPHNGPHEPIPKRHSKFAAFKLKVSDLFNKAMSGPDDADDNMV